MLSRPREAVEGLFSSGSVELRRISKCFIKLEKVLNFYKDSWCKVEKMLRLPLRTMNPVLNINKHWKIGSQHWMALWWGLTVWIYIFWPVFLSRCCVTIQFVCVIYFFPFPFSPIFFDLLLLTKFNRNVGVSGVPTSFMKIFSWVQETAESKHFQKWVDAHFLQRIYRCYHCQLASL